MADTTKWFEVTIKGSLNYNPPEFDDLVPTKTLLNLVPIIQTDCVNVILAALP